VTASGFKVVSTVKIQNRDISRSEVDEERICKGNPLSKLSRYNILNAPPICLHPVLHPVLRLEPAFVSDGYRLNVNYQPSDIRMT